MAKALADRLIREGFTNVSRAGRYRIVTLSGCEQEFVVAPFYATFLKEA
jgi:hypothetical protein